MASGKPQSGSNLLKILECALGALFQQGRIWLESADRKWLASVPRGDTPMPGVSDSGQPDDIRVHLEHIGCPVLCDRLYSGRSQITRGELLGGREDGDVVLKRQALHAWRVSLLHPITRQPLEFEAPIPADMRHLCEGV
jgi:hypothetical protein